MRKSILVLAALFAAMFANAQITFEGTIPRNLNCTTLVDGCDEYYDCGKIPVRTYDSELTSHVVELYNIDCTLYKRIISPVQYGDFFCETKNIFTSDNKISCLIRVRDWDNNKTHFYCYDEDNQLVHDFGELDGTYWEVGIRLVNNEYKLFLAGSNQINVYSLPGNGEATDVSEVSAPQKNARKYLHNDQVLIDSNDKTYTIQGQEVK